MWARSVLPNDDDAASLDFSLDFQVNHPLSSVEFSIAVVAVIEDCASIASDYVAIGCIARGAGLTSPPVELANPLEVSFAAQGTPNPFV